MSEKCVVCQRDLELRFKNMEVGECRHCGLPYKTGDKSGIYRIPIALVKRHLIPELRKAWKEKKNLDDYEKRAKEICRKEG